MDGKIAGICLTVMLLAVMAVGAQAAQITSPDYEKIYDPDERIAEITRPDDSMVMRIQLIRNTDSCLDKCEAEFIINPSSVVRDEKWLFKYGTLHSYKLLLKESTPYLERIPVTECNDICGPVSNATFTGEVCEKKCETVSYDETWKVRTGWKEIKSLAELPMNKNSHVILKGRKSIDDNVEWIPEFFGIEIDEWAWWNTSWLYRKNISIHNLNSSIPLTQGYTINITFDHKTLVTDGKAESNGDDMRVVCNSETTDFINLTQFNKVDTQIFFNLTREIIAGDVNTTECQLFYGNPAASRFTNVTAMPYHNNQNPMRDDFDDSLTLQVCNAGPSAPVYLIDTSGNYGACGFNNTPDITTERYVLTYNMTTPLTGGTIFGFGPGNSTAPNTREYSAMIGLNWLGTSLRFCTDEARSCPTIATGVADVEYRFEIDVDMDQLTKDTGTNVWFINSSGRFLVAASDTFGYDDNGDGRIMANIGFLRAYAQTDQFNLTDITFRKFIIPEPNITLLAEDTRVTDTTPTVSLFNVSTTLSAPNFTIDFNFTDDNLTANCSLLLNGTIFDTNETTVNATRTMLTAANLTNSSLPLTDDDYTVIVSCNDTVNTGNSSAITITIDATRPNITISQPTPENFTILTLELNVSADEAIDTWFYELDGAANVTFTPNITVNFGEGFHDLIVFGNDSANNIGSDSVSFNIDTPPDLFIFSPFNGQVVTGLSTILNFTVLDGISTTFSCDINITNETTQALTAFNGTETARILTLTSFGSKDLNVTCFDAVSNATNSTTFSVIFANYTVNIFDEQTGLLLPDIGSYNATLRTFCDDFERTQNVTVNTFTNFSIDCEFNEIRLILEKNNISYFRTLVPTFFSGNLSWYMINLDTDTPLRLLLSLFDITGRFESGIISINRVINNTGSRTVIQQRLDFDEVFTLFLIGSEKYFYSIRNDAGEVKSFDVNIEITQDTSATVRIEDITSSPVPTDVSIVTSANEGTLTIRSVYFDRLNQTNSVRFWVFNASNSTQVLSEQVVLVSPSVTFSFIFASINDSFKVTVEVDHQRLGLFNDTKIIAFTGVRVPIGVLPQSTLQIFGVFLVMTLLFLFTSLRAEIGSLAASLIGTLLWWWGWLPAAWIGIMIFIMVVSILSLMRRGERG